MDIFTSYNQSAVVSECGLYRYELTRNWRPRESNRTCIFIMLNPSTADGTKDDATILKCVQFAKKFGCGQLIVVNLFAYRETSPKKMMALNNVDVVGPDNKDYIEDTLRCGLYEGNSPLIIAAWGNDGKHIGQDETMLGWLDDKFVECLGTNKNGTPKHPLYIPYEQTLIPFSRPTSEGK